MRLVLCRMWGLMNDEIGDRYIVMFDPLTMEHTMCDWWTALQEMGPTNEWRDRYIVMVWSVYNWLSCGQLCRRFHNLLSLFLPQVCREAPASREINLVIEGSKKYICGYGLNIIERRHNIEILIMVCWTFQLQIQENCTSRPNWLMNQDVRWVSYQIDEYGHFVDTRYVPI